MTEFRIGIRRSAVGERKYIRRTEGKSQFAHLRVSLHSKPGEICQLLPAEGLVLPGDYVHAAEAALIRRISGGPGSFPMHGFVVALTGGSWIEQYSSPQAFAIAADMALEDGLLRAGRVMLESWIGVRMRVEENVFARHVRTLTEMFGEVRIDLSWSHDFVIKIEVPVRAMDRIRQTFGPTPGGLASRNDPETFALPVHQRFREVPVGLPWSRPAELDGWM